jgi:Holliday junction resolvasome RuvABC DNA-binding subunit
MPMYRKPTAKERAKIEKAREKTVQGMAGEKDILSRFSTTSAKAARDMTKEGRKMMEEVPAEARAYEAEMGDPSFKDSSSRKAQGEIEALKALGYAKGGLVTSRGQGKVIRSKKTRIC